jgi:hypothetical protein
MGSDIRAPVGLEWWAANHSSRYIIPFLKTGIGRTPAGQNFVREIGVTWRPFQTEADLRHRVQKDLIDFLLDYALDFQLTPTEIAQLQTLQRVDEAGAPVSDRQEAGHSAVILSPERYIPTEGRLVGGLPTNR